ncbi:MAG: MFS transporter [Gemmatimonadetes bacterium]|nr:MFS transporter [Gemmatimonadota bacterium]
MVHKETRNPSTGPLTTLLQKVVEVRPEEVTLLLLSGAYFFFVLASYYVIRPIRDEMAVVGGVENLAWMFTATLAGTLLVHPLFTWAVSRFPRKRFIPIAYRFFIANLIIFFLSMRMAPDGAYVWIGRVFFSWTSVFNLFVVSVFWAFMADIFRSDQGKRLFGFIGIGGTLGGILGATLTAGLAETLGPVNLLLVSAALLEVALRLVRTLGRRVTLTGFGSRKDEEEAMGGGILSGIQDAFRSPYLLGIIAFMFLFTVTSTAIYYQQTDIVGRSFETPGAPAAFFARIDLFVNVLAVFTQALLTGRIIKWFGLGVALAILPLVTIIGLLALGVSPTLGILFAVQVLRRGWNYGLMKPALETLYTVVPREEKYKAKNFIDTTVYRTGDQMGAWSNRGFMALGMSFTAMAFITAPLAAIWLATGLVLGAAQRRRAKPLNQLSATARS